MITLKQINKALAEAGAKERLYKGNGYFYFSDGDADMWKNESGVYGVFRLNDLTIDRWIEEWKHKHDEYERTK